MAEGHRDPVTGFPLDDLSLAIIEAACTPDNGRTHLLTVLDGWDNELLAVEDGIEIRQGGWDVASCVGALAREVQRLRDGRLP